MFTIAKSFFHFGGSTTCHRQYLPLAGTKTLCKAIAATLASCAMLNALPAGAQSYLTLRQAIEKGVDNYQSIAAGRNYAAASRETAKNVKTNQYLPTLIAGIQADYGTVNSIYGATTGLGANNVLTANAAGPSAAKQNWNAAFGSLYLASVNWDAFTFGRRQTTIKSANAAVRSDSAALQQQIFVHSIRIAGAYFNLLTAERLYKDAQDNLQMAIWVQTTVRARALSGMSAGVDSSMANAAVANARILASTALDAAQGHQNELNQYFNEQSATYILDTSFLATIPLALGMDQKDVSSNPQLQYYGLRTDQSRLRIDSIRKSIMPAISLFGIFQSRGSGFKNSYNPADGSGYSSSIGDGFNPVRNNYLGGLSFSWNLANPWKIKHQMLAQELYTNAYQNEYELLNNQLSNQLTLANQRIENALQRYREVPIELKAAQEAFTQKSVMYKNGLANIVDLQQAQYQLFRAHTDVSVAYANVWEALLLKVASNGNLALLTDQVN